MFRDRILEWSQGLSKVAETWSILSAVVTGTRLVKFASGLRSFEIDTHRIETAREVSRAYIQPFQGNR